MATQIIAKNATALGTPNASDDVYLLGGNGTIGGANNDWSGVTNMNILEVPPEYTGNFGAVGTPLKARINTRLVYDAGGGSMYFESNGSASEVSALVECINRGNFYLMGSGTVTDFYVSGSCFVELGGSAPVTNIRINGGTVDIKDDGVADPTLIQMSSPGGKCTTYRGATTIEHCGGDLTIVCGTATIGTLLVTSSGCHLVESGTISLCKAISGIPDVSNVTRPITIDAATVNMSLAGAKAFTTHPLVTISALTKFPHDGRKAA